jgi:hypothetical protein
LKSVEPHPFLNNMKQRLWTLDAPANSLLVNAPCLNKVISQTPLTVRLPNSATMESSHTAELDSPELNAAASNAHVFPGMANYSLLSVGQLCDEGYIVTFKHASVTVCNS